MDALCEALEELDRDEGVRAIVVTGNERAFAAGADIGEMAEATPIDMLITNRIGQWDRIRKVTKPVIAAVNGWALGGGCELAMTLDIDRRRRGREVRPARDQHRRHPRRRRDAAADARHRQGEGDDDDPDRRADHRARGAQRPGSWRVVTQDELVVEDALALAAKIATKSPLALRLAKEAVNAAYEMSLTDALAHERRLFYLLFASEDQKEGMAAFIEKRDPDFKGR